MSLDPALSARICFVIICLISHQGEDPPHLLIPASKFPSHRTMCWLCVLLNSSSNKSAIKEEPGEGLDVTPTGSSCGGPWVITGKKTPLKDTLGPDVQPGQGKANPAGEANEVDIKEGPLLRWVVKEEGNGSATVLSENEWSLLPLHPSFSGRDGRKSEKEEKMPDAQVENSQHRQEEGKGAGMREQAEKNALCPSILSQLNEEKARGCAECEKTFCMNTHRSQIICTMDKLYQCLGCGKQFNSYGCIVAHKKNLNREKLYKCLECDQRFWRKDELLSHQGTHPGENPYKCWECGEGFHRSLELIRHETHHGGETFYKCLECGEHFHSASLLDAHGQSHAEKQSGIGLECAKSFQTTAYLITYQFPRMEVKPYKCIWCEESFSERSYLDMHTKTHAGEKPFRCVDCGKTFIVRSNLIVHRRVHTGEKPYKCLECGRSFHEKGRLNVHIRTHTGETPYKCLECGRCYSAKKGLIRHTRTHTGEKPYKCVQCGTSFHVRRSVTKHEKTHIK
uniref:C2H2-type domain-containing protein n=1 Tax=Anolis carolinensis TaxID=28377 RepID=A0A803TDY5_ANOCA